MVAQFFEPGACSTSKSKLEVLVFVEESPEKKPRSKERTNNELNPHYETATTGIEPGSQRWAVSAYPLRHLCSPITTEVEGNNQYY